MFEPYLGVNMQHFDLFVIGAGSAGVRASRMAATLGLKVAVAESQFYGGTCVNVGCIPKKLFVYASEFTQQAHEAKGFGLDFTLNNFDWATLRDNKTTEIHRLNGIYQSLLDNAGVQTFWGHAKLISNKEIVIGNNHFTADKILLATGGSPVSLDIPGSEYCINSNDFFYMDNFPKSALVVGSGYIAVEFAGILNGLNCETSIASRSGKLLKDFDGSTREFAQNQILNKGITLISEQPASIEQVQDGYKVSFKSGFSKVVETVILAAGRVPNITNLGFKELGGKLNHDGTITTDSFYQTNLEGVYAIGDLINTPQLTPVALAEAMTFLKNQYKNDLTPLDYQNIPTAVFCQPNLATVGLTEERALEKGININVFESNFRGLRLTLTQETERTYMKLIVDTQTDKVIGAHMVGEHASEILQGIAIAIKAGATKSIFDETIGIHPSSAEEFVTMRTPRQ